MRRVRSARNKKFRGKSSAGAWWGAEYWIRRCRFSAPFQLKGGSLHYSVPKQRNIGRPRCAPTNPIDLSTWNLLKLLSRPSPSALLPIIDLLARKLKEKCTLSILITGAILVKSVKKKRVLFAHKNITLSVEIPRCIEEPKEKWWKKYKRRDPSERSTKWRSRRFHGIYRPLFFTPGFLHTVWDNRCAEVCGHFSKLAEMRCPGPGPVSKIRRRFVRVSRPRPLFKFSKPRQNGADRGKGGIFLVP